MNAIVLTGGTSRRFGSDKASAKVNGRTLLQILVSHLYCDKLIIVGPKTDIDAIYIEEEPKSGGPVAAIAAGMKLVESEFVAIYATDMPFAPLILNKLKSALKNDGALAMDAEGELQPLAGVYRSAKLKQALSQFPTIENRSVRELIAKLSIDEVILDNHDFLLDIDTPDVLSLAIDLDSRLSQ